jgi:16S rRNA processing protein RimM
MPPTLAASNVDDLIVVARIARPQGIRGEVIADLLTDFPERFAKLENACVKKPNGELLILRLEGFRPHKGRVVLKFAGYDTMNAAEELRDARVMITHDQLVKLPEDTFYDFDLIDCEVTTTGGQPVGRVKSVQSYGAAPLLAVEEGEKEHLIPLASSICIEIDVAQKRIVIDPPEGLLEL